MDEHRFDNIENFLHSKNPSKILDQLNADEINVLFKKLREHNSHITKLARQDPLTQLPNRFYFELSSRRMLAQAKRRGQKLCVLAMDLDGFKLVNDRYGHAVGDSVLQVVGTTLRGIVRDEDLVARTGGDEFIIILPCLVHYSDAGRVAEKIIQALGRAKIPDYPDVSIRCSIGIAGYPAAAESMDRLLECADTALYSAKEHGPCSFEYFTEKVKQEYRYNKKLIATLEKHLNNKTLSLSYLPIYSNTDERIVAVEIKVPGIHEVLPYVENKEQLYGRLSCEYLEKVFSDFLTFQKTDLKHILLFLTVNTVMFCHDEFKKSLEHFVTQNALFKDQLCLKLVGVSGTQIPESSFLFYRELGVDLCFTYQSDQPSTLKRLRDSAPKYIDISLEDVYSTSTTFERNRDFISGLVMLATSLDIGVLLSQVETAEQQSLAKVTKASFVCGGALSLSQTQKGLLKLLCLH